jgi:hypothetical protein
VIFPALLLMNVFIRGTMPATNSTEGKLENGLREPELQCSGRNFVKIAKALGIAISDGKFSEALSDKGRLDPWVGEKLLGLLQEMRDLRTTVNAPMDWSSTEEIAKQLALARATREAVKYDEDVIRKFLDDVTTS